MNDERDGIGLGGALADDPHLVFVVRHALYLRNYESMIRELAARGWRITLAATTGSRSVDESLAHRLAAEHPRVTWTYLPRATGLVQDGLEAVYATLDWLRFQDGSYTGAPDLEARARRRVVTPIRLTLQAYGVRRNTRRTLTAQARFQRLARHAQADRTIVDALAGLRPTVLAVTPLIDIGGGQTAYLQAAGPLGVPTAAMIASWDNLSIKGLIHHTPDRVVVWNRQLADVAVRHHAVPRHRISTTGASLFDWLKEPMTLPDRVTFLTRLGLDPAAPLIVYAGSSGIVGPQEWAYLTSTYLPALRSYWDPRVAKANVIVRPHPTNPLKGSKTRPAFIAHGVVLDPLSGRPVIDDETRMHYRALLTHADVVVGINTSTFLEAAVCGTPCVPLTSRKLSKSQQSAPHFRMLEDAGLFPHPRSLYGNLEAIAEQLAIPSRSADRLAAFNARFVDPPAEAESATQAAVAVLSGLHDMPRPAPTDANAPLAARVALGAVGLVTQADQAAAGLAKRVVRLKLANPQPVGNTGTGSDASPTERSPKTARAESASAAKERQRRERHREKTVIAFKVDTQRVLSGPDRMGSARRMGRRATKIGRRRVRTLPGLRRPDVNAPNTPLNAAAEAFYAGVTAPALALRANRASGQRYSRLNTELGRAAAAGRPIVFGPWTSEVGFEVLYWTAFVRRLVSAHRLQAGQITVISRGATLEWYGLAGSHYHDVFEVIGPEEFHLRIGDTGRGKKQVTWTADERMLVARLAPDDAFVVHPREMYLTLMPFFSGHTPLPWLNSYLTPRRLADLHYRDSRLDEAWIEIASALPARFLAVGLYQRPSFSPRNSREPLRLLLERLQDRGIALVSLETGLDIDDHRAVDLTPADVTRPLLGVDARWNLGMQSRIIGASMGLLGTYGGLSYLGGELGVPTVGLYDDRNKIIWRHLDVARARFDQSVPFSVFDLTAADPDKVVEALAPEPSGALRKEYA